MFRHFSYRRDQNKSAHNSRAKNSNVTKATPPFFMSLGIDLSVCVIQAPNAARTFGHGYNQLVLAERKPHPRNI